MDAVRVWRGWHGQACGSPIVVGPCSPTHRAGGSLPAGTLGVGILDEPRLEQRLDHADDRVMNHPIAECRRRDGAALGLVNLEVVVPSVAIRSGEKLLPQRHQRIFHLGEERAARRRRGKPFTLCKWPVDRPRNWRALVNAPLDEKQLQQLRTCVNRGQPFGDPNWVQRIAKRLRLEFTLRNAGRPRKRGNNQ